MKPLERNGLTRLLKTEKPKTIEPVIQKLSDNDYFG